jgi:putative hydrolase of the HAD superfamily
MTGDVDAVLLDAGGVLLMPDPEAFRTHLAPFGVSPDDESCRRAHYLGMAELDRIGVTDYPHADRIIARFLGVAEEDVEAAVPALHAVYVREPFVPVPGAAAQLRRLADAGLSLAIVSNAEGTVEAQLASHGICAVGGAEVADVAIVVDSHVVGVEKPDPAIFAFALDAVGVPPERCVYVGDSVHFDVHGARAAGIPGVHLMPYPSCLDESGHPHAVSLEEFADTLLG